MPAIIYPIGAEQKDMAFQVANRAKEVLNDTMKGCAADPDNVKGLTIASVKSECFDVKTVGGNAVFVVSTSADGKSETVSLKRLQSPIEGLVFTQEEPAKKGDRLVVLGCASFEKITTLGKTEQLKIALQTHKTVDALAPAVASLVKGQGTLVSLVVLPYGEEESIVGVLSGKTEIFTKTMLRGIVLAGRRPSEDTLPVSARSPARAASTDDALVVAGVPNHQQEQRARKHRYRLFFAGGFAVAAVAAAALLGGGKGGGPSAPRPK